MLYEPFGPVSGWSWGNSTIAARVYDTDGKPTAIDSAGQRTLRLRRRLPHHLDHRSLRQHQELDPWLRRARPVELSRARPGQTIGYTYDANGNRLTQTGTQTATYTISSTNNRVASISGTPTRAFNYDAAGNTTADGTLTFTYRDNGRMSSVTSGGATTSYVLNALGQRVKKANSSLTRLVVYDEAGHLLGGLRRRRRACPGNRVDARHSCRDATAPNGGGVSLFYIHTDHLNTPRRISRPSDDVILWRWDSDPFGSAAASEDPDGDSTLFVNNLRFPGQYADAESGLTYNYFRDYDPAIGRYVESDPIGLEGGWNTYAYVDGDPLSRIDEEGLEDKKPEIPGGHDNNQRESNRERHEEGDSRRQSNHTEAKRVMPSGGCRRSGRPG